MRRTGRILIALLAVVLVLTIAALIVAPFAIERMVKAELGKRGIEAVEMEVGAPGLGGTTLRGVRLGADGAFTADELAVEYSLPELAQRRIERIRLVRPRLRMSVDDAGDVSFGSLDPLLRGSDQPSEGQAPQLGLPAPLEIVDGAVTASTPTGEVTARLEGAVTIEPGAGPLKLAIQAPWLSAALELRLKQDGSALSISGRVSEGRITHPLLSASFAGPFTAAFGGDTPAATAELNWTDLRSPLFQIGTAAASGNLSAWYERGRVAGDLRLTAPGGRFELSLLGETPQRLQIALEGDGLAVPELMTEAQLQASVELDPAARAATLAEAANVEGRLAPELVGALPAAMQPALAEGPLFLTADPGSQITQGSSGLSASGRLTLARPELFELVLEGSLSPQAGATSASARLRLNAPNLTLAGYSLKKLSLTAPVSATFNGERTEIRLTGPAPLSIGALESGATRLTALSIPLQPQEQPLFASAPDGSAFALGAGAAKAEGRFGQDREPFTLAWKEAAVAGRPGALLTA
ncbi:MAG: hypothetical protein K0S81_2276, partial [Rhodospirillales bacterium]|nr:hypothetical protein [Rhodospirillales bacterium]